MSGIALNDDWSHFFIHHRQEEMTEDGLRAFAEQYGGTQVRDFFVNPNGQRTVYRSKVRESIFTGFCPDNPDDERFFGSEGHRAWAFNDGKLREYAQNTYDLDRRGVDPFAVWMKEFRNAGIHPWISMRMNDVHGAFDEKYFLHDAFWRKNPQYRTGEYRWAGNWGDRTLDYGRREVFDYQMALAEELMERYDMDGLELDWMRTPPHFRPGFDEQGIAVLTEFTRLVRQKLDAWEKKRGHGIRLSARVPHSPEDALGLGMDAASWAREGLIDWLTVSPYFSATSHDVPVRVWKQLLRGTGVTLAVCTDVPVAAYPGAKQLQQTSVTARGQAESMLWQGADVVYLFNHYDNAFTISDLENYRDMLCQVGQLYTLRGLRRRHIISYRDCVGRGMALGSLLPARLPGKGASFDARLCLGDVTGVTQARVVFGGEGDVRVRVNGVSCGCAAAYSQDAPAPNLPLFCVDVPLKALHDGWNNLELFSETAACVQWLEMDLH